MKIKNIKAIIWDLDGTLLDSFKLFVAVLTEISIERGLSPIDYKVLATNFHGSLEDSIKNSLGIESEQELTEIVESFLKKQDPQHKDAGRHLFNDALELAQRAAKKDITQIIVTNRAHKGRGHGSPRAIVASTVLADCIKEVHCGDEVEFRKPDARVISGWLEEEGINSDDVLVIGDQFVDAQLAANLGAKGLLIKRGEEIAHLHKLTDSEKERLYVVDTFDEVEFA